MALARVKTWNPGDVLTAADLNGEYNNILNNPITLISPSTAPINFNLLAHTNLLPSVITGTSANTGQVLSVTSSGTVPIFLSAIPVDSRVRGLLGLLSSQSGTFSADSYVQRTTDGLRAWSVTATSSYSASVGTAGPAAGGRDIAGSFASTYVHWYAITTGPGSTAPAGLVSTNPPNVGPVALPVGYLGWTYLGGSVYSSSSTTLPAGHTFRGATAYYNSGVVVLSGGTSTQDANVSLSAAIPNNSLDVGISMSAIGSVVILAQPLATIGSTTGTYGAVAPFSLNGVANFKDVGFVQLPNVGQNIVYNWNSTSSDPALSLSVESYGMPNGGK